MLKPTTWRPLAPSIRKEGRMVRVPGMTGCSVAGTHSRCPTTWVCPPFRTLTRTHGPQ